MESHASTVFCCDTQLVAVGGQENGNNEWDFFVSHVPEDQDWAEWIAAVLEADRNRVLVQAWDFVPGVNWPALLQAGLLRGGRMVAVLSRAYLASAGGNSEWQAVWAADPSGDGRRLIPVRVEACDPQVLGLVGTRRWIDLADLSGPAHESTARQRLLAGVEAARVGRVRPAGPFLLPTRDGDTDPVAIRLADSARVANVIDVDTSTVCPHMVPPRTGPFVVRARLRDDLLRLLTAPDAGLVGITMALHGAGGFGKTTLAAETCRLPEIRGAFPDGVLWVTVGERAADAELAAKINDLSELLSGQRPTLSGPEQAGYHLGRLLEERRALLVVDDVWHRSQLLPFLYGGAGCVRLVASRVRGILPDGAALLLVDAMEHAEARALLAAGIGTGAAAGSSPDEGTVGLPPAQLDRLAALTGRWPVLLGLVSRTLRRAVRTGVSAIDAAEAIERRLRRDGPVALDLRSADARELAVAATMEASLALLPAGQLDRYLELAVFPEGADIPLAVLDVWWAAARGADGPSTEQICEDLADLALVSSYQQDTRTLRLHDIVHAYLRGRVGPMRLAALHADLLAAAARLLPAAHSPNPAHANAGDAGVGGGDSADDLHLASRARPWWLLPQEADYLWRELGYHLAEAGRGDELATTICDLRYVTAKLRLLGPVPVEADLARVDGPVAGELRRSLGRAAHLLTPTEPAHALTGILLNRLAQTPSLMPMTEVFAATLPDVRLASRWPLPDAPDPALRRVLHGHAGGIFAAAVSGDGRLLAAAEASGAVRVWEAATGRVVTTLTGSPASVVTCAISPDDRWLVSGDTAGEIRIWDLATRQLRQVLSGHAVGVRSCAISPDGTWLASGDTGGDVRLWDVVTGRTRRVLVGVAGVRICTIGPDGTWLASGHTTGDIRIWDLRSGEARLLSADDLGGVRATVASPDGTWLAAGYTTGTIRLWDTATGQTRAILTGHIAEVYALAVGPDGQWLASGSLDRTIRIWDVSEARTTGVLGGHTAGVRACVVSPDGTWLASADQVGVVQVWDVALARRPGSAAAPATGIRSCAFSPDGQLLAVGEVTGTVRIWDVAGEDTAMVLRGHTGGVWECPFSPDGQRLATASDDRTVRVWDLERHTSIVLSSHDAEVWGCSFTPDGARLASCDSGGGVRIWDVDTATAVQELPGHTAGVWACPVGPDGTWLATGGEDQTVRIWDLSSGQTRTMLPHPAAVWMCAVSPGGDVVVSGDADGTTRIFDRHGGQLRHVLPGHAGGVWWCDISPDGRRLATTGGDQTVRLWDVATGQGVAILTGHVGAVWSCAFSPDGSTIASTDGAGSIRLWSSVTGRIRSVLSYHTSVLWCTAASPDGQWLAVGGLDDDGAATLQLWDVATRCRRDLPTAGMPGIRACVAGSDGSWLVAVDTAGQIRIWDVSSGEVTAVGTASATPAAPVTAGETVPPRAQADGARPQTLGVPGARVRTCALGPDDGWLLAGGSDGILRILDVATGTCLRTIDAHQADVRCTAVAPDGRWVASGDASGSLVITNQADGTVQARLDGLAAAVSSCATGPDGSWLAIGDAAGGLRLWDPAGDILLAVLDGHTAGVSSCAASADGRWLASVDLDGVLRIWDVEQGCCATMTRVESSLFGCCWLPDMPAVAATGVGGVFLFTLVTPATHRDGPPTRLEPLDCHD